MSNDSSAAVPPESDPKEPATHVEALDAQGRRVRIPREEYRTRVLPDMVKANEANPEQLTGVIMQAVQQGFAEDVIGAANKLTVVDKQNPERALSVLAVVQRDTGELDLAEATLRELLQKKPESAAGYVGLGMIEERRGNVDACIDFLWQALAKDSNHPDAVHAYLQIQHRQVGDEGYRAELDKLIALPDAWRAKLWLARLHLNEGDEAAATAIYREMLPKPEVAGDALLMAVGDLVQRQKHDLVDELIVPNFRPGQHHPHVGLALLQHYHAQKKHVEGEALLHDMFCHYQHMVAGELQPFTAEFDRMRLEQMPPPPAPPANPKVQIMRLDRPAWYAGFEDPAWMLPPKQAGHKHVVVFALSVEGQPELEPAQQDELGRAIRGLPLWFAEQLWLGTPHRGTAALPMAEHGGWAVLGRPWPEEQLASQVPEAERADTIFVTGNLRIDGDRRRIEMFAYDCAKQQRIGEVSAEGAHIEHGKMLMELMAKLWPILGGPVDFKPELGDENFWHRYSDGMSQHAALVLTQAGGLPRDRLYGERYITQWLQSAALMETRWQPGFWLLGSALCVLQQLGSHVATEHGRLIAEVFRQSPANSPFARLGARILPAAGLLPLWQSRRDEIVQAAQGEPAVAAWLQQVEPKSS
ncbi:MAG: tetratricopeptide repeat protein [Planctomycetota bacterium]